MWRRKAWGKAEFLIGGNLLIVACDIRSTAATRPVLSQRRSFLPTTIPFREKILLTPCDVFGEPCLGNQGLEQNGRDPAAFSRVWTRGEGAKSPEMIFGKICLSISKAILGNCHFATRKAGLIHL